MSVERWLPVVGYEGLYEVSDHGRIRSVDRIITRRWQSPSPYRGRILKPAEREWQLQVGLHRQNRWRGVGVHRLVLEAFVGPCPPGMEGCHSDGDFHNNHLDNLRWDTHSGNIHDSVAHGTHPHATKTRCNNGHEYTDANTYVNPKGERICRVCRRKWWRDWDEKQRQPFGGCNQSSLEPMEVDW